MRRRTLLQGLTASVALAGLKGPLALASGHTRRLVVFYNEGGWDPSFVFDPHFDDNTVDGDPGATPSVVNGIEFAHSPNRPSVKAFFQAYGSESVVLNGMRIPSISHTQGTRLLLTGRRSLDAPDLPTMVAQHYGGDKPLPHLVISGPRFPGGVSGTMVPLSHTLTGTVRGDLPAHFQESEQHAEALQEFLNTEYQVLDGDQALFQRLSSAWSRRSELGQDFPLDISLDPTISSEIDNLVDAFQAGISCCATLKCKLPQLVDWDSHSDNSLNQSQAFETSFSQLKELVDALSDGGLLATTTVLVVSEMGRSPMLNSLGGKDHWPYTSAMIVGAGVRGGQVIGASNEQLIGEKIDFNTGGLASSGTEVDVVNLHAGLLAAFDIDPEQYFPGIPVFEAPFSG
jgi:hypothetical protein